MNERIITQIDYELELIKQLKRSFTTHFRVCPEKIYHCLARSYKEREESQTKSQISPEKEGIFKNGM